MTDDKKFGYGMFPSMRSIYGKWLSNGEKKEELQTTSPSTLNLYTQMTTALSDYKSATNAKDRFKAESRICRIADRFDQYTMITMPNGSISVPTVEHWKGFRIPRLEKVFETNRDFSIIPIEDVRTNPLFRAFLGSDEMVEDYLDILRKEGKTKIGLYFSDELEGRLVGVLKIRTY